MLQRKVEARTGGMLNFNTLSLGENYQFNLVSFFQTRYKAVLSLVAGEILACFGDGNKVSITSPTF